MSAALLDSANPSGPITIHDLQVTVDRDLCIGAATCVAVAPETFLLDSEAKAIILKTASQNDQDTIIDAARACPVAAIFVKDTNGNAIYPD